MKKRLPQKKRRPGKKAPRVNSLRAFLDDLQGAGRYSFAAGEALKALGVSSIALRSALWRLARSRRVASPRRGFYVIVPPEHRAVGCPSPEWFIDDLMAYLGCPYYVGLLTAGALHGAAH